MKYVWILLLFIPLGVDAQLLTLSYGPSEQGDTVVSDTSTSAAVWYKFENSTADASGNGVTGSYSGSYDSNTVKEGNYSVEFESADIWTYSAFTLNDTFAYCFWYYHEDLESEGYKTYMMLRGNTTDGESIELDQINGDIEHHKFVSGVDYEARTSNANPGLPNYHDQWVFIIIQVKGQRTRIYFNDTDVTSADSTTITNDFGAGTITMGTSVNSNVDNLQIYNFELTSDQRTYLYNNPTKSLQGAQEEEGGGEAPTYGDADCYGWFAFNGDLTDEQGIQSGVGVETVTYEGDTCLIFSESDGDDEINISNLESTRGVTGDVSFSYRIYLDDGITNLNHYAHGSSTGWNADGIFVYFDPTGTGYFNWLASVGDGASSSYATMATSPYASDIEDDTWYDIAEVWDVSAAGDEVYVQLWVDGVMFNEADTVITNMAPVNLDLDYFIGGKNGGTAGLRDGDKLDEFRVYPFRLSPAQIAELDNDPYNLPSE